MTKHAKFKMEMFMKNSLKIFMLSGLLFLNALGSQTPPPNQQQKENPRSSRKRPRSPQQEQEPGSPDFDDRPVTSSFMSSFAADEGPEAASSAAASGNNLQQPELLSPNFYPAQSDYPDYDFSAQATQSLGDYSLHLDYSQPAIPASTRRNELRSPNPDDYFASDSFLYDYPTDKQQEPFSYAAASSTAAHRPPTPAAAASSAYTFAAAQAYSQNADSYDSTANNPEIASAAIVLRRDQEPLPKGLPFPPKFYAKAKAKGKTSAAVNASPSPSCSAPCGNPKCLLSILTTKKMILECRSKEIKQFLNRCSNRAIHRIDGEPLGFILLDKAHSKHWSEMLIEILNARGGHDFFEHQDMNGKTTLHKLVNNTSKAQIIKELYQKLAHYDTEDSQGHTPLYDVIKHLKDNHDALSFERIQCVHEKIRILLSRRATINNDMLNLAKAIQYRGATKNYALGWLKEAQQLREQSMSPIMAASVSSPDEHALLYKAIENLKNNYNNLNNNTIRPFNKKIKKLSLRSATIDDQIFDLARQIPYKGVRNYAIELLQQALKPRNQNMPPIMTANTSSTADVTNSQPLAPSTSSAAAASSAHAPATQTYSQTTDSPGHTANHPEIASAAAASSADAANSFPDSSSSTHCNDTHCGLSTLTTKEMALGCRSQKIKQFLNICSNRAIHRINGKPLGFILLDKAHSKHWSEMLIEVLNTQSGHEFFEHQDMNGKTTLHKLVNNTSKAQIIKELYQKLAHYDTEDLQGHTPLYDAIKHLKDNHDALRPEGIQRVHEKIKILSSRGATIDEKILNLVISITNNYTQSYIGRFLENTLQSRGQAIANRDISPAAASASSASAMIAHQQSAPEGAAAAAASSASAPAAQTQEDDGGVRGMDMNEDE